MSVATVRLGDGRTVKLGRLRPRARPQVLAFGRYFDPAAATPPPAKVDYSPKAMAALRRMYLNDTYGDCVIAGKMHQLGLWSGNDSDSGGVILATDQEVARQYFAICGPGDNGCYIPHVLNVMKERGLVAGGKSYTIDGYVSVNWTNRLEVQVAIYLFGSLTLGINLPAAWARGGDGSTWDATNTQIIGGHDVCAVGYDERGVQIATWGGLRTITWRAFTSTRWLEECYAQLAPAWYGNDKLAPSGVDAAALANDLAKLGGGDIPPLPGPNPVPPEPGPTPTPPPVPPLVVPPFIDLGNHRINLDEYLAAGWTFYGEPDGVGVADEPGSAPRHVITRVFTRAALKRQGYSHAEIAPMLELATDELIDGVAAAEGVDFPTVCGDVVILMSGGGIIEALIAFLQSEQGQALIAALVKVLIAAVGA